MSEENPLEDSVQEIVEDYSDLVRDISSEKWPPTGNYYFITASLSIKI